MALNIKGIGVVFRFGSRGYPEPTDGSLDALQDSVFSILNTVRGERVHRPTFGCDLKSLIHSNMGRGAALRAKIEAQTAVERQERRVSVDLTTVTRSGSTISVDVIWRPKGNLSQTRRSSAVFDVGGA